MNLTNKTDKELMDIIERATLLLNNGKSFDPNFILKGISIHKSESEATNIFGRPNNCDYNGWRNDYWLSYDWFTLSGCGHDGMLETISLNDEYGTSLHHYLNEEMWDGLDENEIEEIEEITGCSTHGEYVEFINDFIKGL